MQEDAKQPPKAAMGQASSSSTQTLASVDLEKDKNLLTLVFRGKLQVEQQDSPADSSENVVLVDEEGGLVVILVRAKVEAGAGALVPSTWVVDEATILEVLNEVPIAGAHPDKVGETDVILLVLSAARVLLLPPSLPASPANRRALCQKLGERQQGSTLANSVVVAPPNTPARSSASSTSSSSSSSFLVNEEADQSNASTTSQSTENGEVRTPPSFPMLDVRLLQYDGHDKSLQPNTIHSQSFENDLFKGRVLLVLKPPNPSDDSYYTERIFSKKKRIFVLQLQGQFKKKPQGQVYVGGEITKPIRVGLLTRGVIGILLRFMETFYSDVVYSFGDNDGKENPRVVIPAQWAFSRVETTPPDQTPPVVTHEVFAEADDVRKRRMKAKTWDWNTSDTYSFTFFSMYFNLVDWKIINMPVSGGINLASMWNDAALRIVMYENDGKGRKHLQKQNRYYFSMQMQHSSNYGDSSEDDEAELEKTMSLTRTTSRLWENEGMVRSESMLFPETQPGDLSDSEEDEFYDAEENLVDLDAATVTKSPAGASGVTLASIDVTVPALVEMSGGKGGYHRYYAINIGAKTALRSRGDCDICIERSGLKAATTFVSSSFSPMLAPNEQKRRMLGYVLLKAGSHENLPGLDESEAFLRPDAEQLNTNILFSGIVARAVSDKHWVEERVTIAHDGCITLRRTDKKRSSVRVHATSILGVNIFEGRDCPAFQGFFFLCIETFGRSIYLMFASSPQRDSFHKTIADLTKSNQSPNMAETALMDYDRPAQEFMHDSSMWDCKKRRIYNCAQFAFRITEGRIDKPLAAIEEALLLGIRSMKDESLRTRRKFFQSVALLKMVDLQPLSEVEKLVFYLNLYHTMVLHGFLVLGPPSTSLRFMSLFKEVAYEVGDDIMSIAELEHCVLRAAMSSPSNFLSRFVIPKSHYRHALSTRDFRINFALNCGSTSTPPVVLLYKVECLSEQLDTATRLYMEGVSVKKPGFRDVVVTLPRACQWFAQDFDMDLVTTLAPYLREDLRSKLSGCFLPSSGAYDLGCINVKFDDFSFSCRPLSLLKE